MDGNTSIWNVIGAMQSFSSVTDQAAGGEPSTRSERGRAERSGGGSPPSSYLESTEKHCDKTEEEEDDAGAREEKIPRTSIGQRLAQCGEATVVMRIVEQLDSATGKVREVRQFVHRLELTLEQRATYLGRSLPEGRRRLDLIEREVIKIFYG